MNNEQFERIFEAVIDQSRKVLLKKAEEYASDDDRLHNFHVAAVFQGISPEEALWGMATKHLVSISDMVRDGEIHSEEQWNEKIGDALNYLILLRAQVLETDDNRTQENALPPPLDFESLSPVSRVMSDPSGAGRHLTSDQPD